MEDKSHSHQTSYLQFVELHDTYTAELLVDNLCGQDLDRILTDLNSKVGLILDTCEPIDLPAVTSITPQHSIIQSADPLRSISLQQPFNLATGYQAGNISIQSAYGPQYQPQPYASPYQQRFGPIGPPITPSHIIPYPEMSIGSPITPVRIVQYPREPPIELKSISALDLAKSIVPVDVAIHPQSAEQHPYKSTSLVISTSKKELVDNK